MALIDYIHSEISKKEKEGVSPACITEKEVIDYVVSKTLETLSDMEKNGQIRRRRGINDTLIFKD